jgi:tetratricopeptide (TPR) repeat protein
LFVEEKEFSGRIVLWLVCLALLTACFLQVDIDELYYRSLPAPATPKPPADPKERALLKHLQQLEEEYFVVIKRPISSRQAQALGEEIYRGARNNSSFLTEFAWRIMAERGTRYRDLNLALRAAQTAVELSKSKSIWVTTTYARALFENGQIEEAIEYQEKALAAAETNQDRGDCEATLNKYKRVLRERRSRENR